MFIFLRNVLNRYIVLLSAFIGAMFATAGACGQQIRIDTSLVLPTGDIRLDSLSERLHSQSGYVLSFNASSIQPASPIKILRSPVHLITLLDYLKVKYRLIYTILGDHIILDRLPENIPKIKRRQISSYAEKAFKKVPYEPGKPRAVKVKVDSKLLKEHLRPNDSTLHQIALLPIKGKFYVADRPSTTAFTDLSHLLMVNKPSRTSYTPFSGDSNALPLPAKKTILTNRVLFSVGITVDETFYLSPEIKLGFPFLYLTGSWRTNFTISGFGYGIGNSYKLSKTWGIQANINRGSLRNTYSTNYQLTTNSYPYDTTSLIRIKGTLMRGELFADKTLSNKLIVQFGPVFNLLNYTIYTGGKPISQASSLPPIDIDIYKQYDLLKPPYTITDSYNKKTASGRKIWIGFQAGLFYCF